MECCVAIQPPTYSLYFLFTVVPCVFGQSVYLNNNPRSNPKREGGEGDGTKVIIFYSRMKLDHNHTSP